MGNRLSKKIGSGKKKSSDDRDGSKGACSESSVYNSSSSSKWSTKKDKSGGYRNFREETRDEHLTVLDFMIRTADDEYLMAMVDDDDEYYSSEKTIDERFPIYLRHLLVKYSNHAKGEPRMDYKEYRIRVSDISMQNYDGLDESDALRDIYHSDHQQSYAYTHNRAGFLRDYVNVTMDCIDSSKIQLKIPMMALIMNDCNSTRVSIENVMSTMSMVNCANFTLIYSDHKRDTDTAMISCDMCCDIRVSLPLECHCQKSFQMSVSRTDKVTVHFRPLDWECRVDLTDQLAFNDIFHHKLVFDPIRRSVQFDGKYLKKAEEEDTSELVTSEGLD